MAKKGTTIGGIDLSEFGKDLEIAEEKKVEDKTIDNSHLLGLFDTDSESDKGLADFCNNLGVDIRDEEDIAREEMEASKRYMDVTLESGEVSLDPVTQTTEEVNRDKIITYGENKHLDEDEVLKDLDIESGVTIDGITEDLDLDDNILSKLIPGYNEQSNDRSIKVEDGESLEVSVDPITEEKIDLFGGGKITRDYNKEDNDGRDLDDKEIISDVKIDPSTEDSIVTEVQKEDEYQDRYSKIYENRDTMNLKWDGSHELSKQGSEEGNSAEDLFKEDDQVISSSDDQISDAIFSSLLGDTGKEEVIVNKKEEKSEDFIVEVKKEEGEVDSEKDDSVLLTWSAPLEQEEDFYSEQEEESKINNTKINIGGDNFSLEEILSNNLNTIPILDTSSSMDVDSSLDAAFERLSNISNTIKENIDKSEKQEESETLLEAKKLEEERLKIERDRMALEQERLKLEQERLKAMEETRQEKENENQIITIEDSKVESESNQSYSEELISKSHEEEDNNHKEDVIEDTIIEEQSSPEEDSEITESDSNEEIQEVMSSMEIDIPQSNDDWNILKGISEDYEEAVKFNEDVDLVEDIKNMFESTDEATLNLIKIRQTLESKLNSANVEIGSTFEMKLDFKTKKEVEGNGFTVEQVLDEEGNIDEENIVVFLTNPPKALNSRRTDYIKFLNDFKEASRKIMKLGKPVLVRVRSSDFVPYVTLEEVNLLIENLPLKFILSNNKRYITLDMKI